MYDNFKLLREKYDGLKEEIHHILWEYLPSDRRQPQMKRKRHPHQHVRTRADYGCANDFSIHNLEQDEYDAFDEHIFDEIATVNHAIFETPDCIGQYEIGPLLGEGRFADVKLCTHTITKRQLAVKILIKSKVKSLSGLRRIQREIKVLRTVRHPNIVKLVNILHSPKHIYLMMELAGGKDLFEFFDENPKGVGCTNVAKQIVLGIALPLCYIHHVMGICHRDLKPENILLSPPNIHHASNNGLSNITYKNIRICDFGQCARCTSTKSQNREGYEKDIFLLKELSGSPGFFAPEMILGGEEGYDGRLADIWSLGCIMLELTRGHGDFCKDWMTSYDYHVLQDETSFQHCLDAAVQKINATCCPTDIGNDKTQEFHNMRNFLSRLLVVNPQERIASGEILSHPWLAGEIQENEKHEKEAGSMERNVAGDNANCIEIYAPLELANEEKDRIHTKTRPSIDTEPTEQQPQQQHYQSDHRDSHDQFECSDNKAKNLAKTPSTRRGSNKSKRNIFRNSFSSRARKHFAGSDEVGEKVVLTHVVDTLVDNALTIIQKDNVHPLDGPPYGQDQRENPISQVEIQLPPIEPNTPSSKAVKDAMVEGEIIVMTFASPTPASPMKIATVT